MTDLQSKCACHHDEDNSFNPAFSAIMGLLVVQNIGGKEVQIAINAQARKPVDNAFHVPRCMDL
jgi:hypothetical protein